MNIDNSTRKAVERCLDYRIPFALFAFPGETNYRFYASPAEKSESTSVFVDGNADCFFINFFDNDEPYTPSIQFRMSADTVLDYCEKELIEQPLAEIRPRIASTYRVSYHDAFSRIIPRLKAEGGKVVLSRMRTIFTMKHPLEISEEYFDLSDSTFRYMCYTPETGVWLGSTPEILLESDFKKREIRTMALAGTRSADDDSPWDEKNIHEQSIVTDFIVEALKSEGLDVTVNELSERKFLNIKHLCTDITARGEVDIPSLMTALSPTPAVAGYPRETAVDEICRYETHRRNCYGGYVGVRIGGNYHAYVNLRCCFAAPVVRMADGVGVAGFGWLCNLYAGGGIVAKSIEEDEWAETSAKTQKLSEILIGKNGCGVEGPELKAHRIEFNERVAAKLCF